MKTKYLLILPLFFFLQSCIVSEKSFYNEETRGNATVTKVNIPMFLVKPYIKRALRDEGESEELINLIRKISKIKVYTIENGTEKIAENFNHKTFGSDFQEYITVNSKDTKIKILSKENSELIKNFIINVKDDKDLVFIDIKGKFTLEDLAEIGNLTEKNKNNFRKNQ